MLRVLVVSVPANKICTVYVHHNAAFVVDPRDIRADENGTWIRKGSPVGYASVSTDANGMTTIFRRSKLGCTSNQYKVTLSPLSFSRL